MKKKVFSMLSVLFMAALCAGFVSCDDEADEVGGKTRTVQITNRSGMILYQFTVVWADVNDNVMSQDGKGDLYSGDKITVEVPVGANKFYMAYYNKNLGTWLYSPIYSVGSKTFTLTEFDVSQWTTD
ncbi:MAG: hypothetical protein SPL50_07010 [Alloprevotella sp.]|nr:hypothetical protein [Alloprevotella sp.]